MIETRTIPVLARGGERDIINDSTKPPVSQSEAEPAIHLLDNWFDPIEATLRNRVRSFIQAMIETELETVLMRPRYGRRPKTDSENAGGPETITGHTTQSSIPLADRDIWSLAGLAARS
jgi:hypothetical protein